MEQSSQTRVRRARRPWTDEDQRRAEELRAQGLSYYAIAKALGANRGAVQCRLDPVANEKRRVKSAMWHSANRDAANARRHQWYWDNLERNRQYARRRREADRSGDAERARRWYHKNRDRAIARRRRWGDLNPDKVRALQSAFYQKNKAHLSEYKLKWAQANRDRVRENNRRREAIKRAARKCAIVPMGHGATRDRFALFGGCCAYCGEAGRVTVDHVLALSAGGLDEASNVVPACLRCNSSKQARPVESWYRRQPFFSEVRWRRIVRHCPEAVVGQIPLALPLSVSA